MNDRHNLFIVRSPMQLVNALEAKHHFKCKNNVLALVYPRGLINAKQLKDVVNEDDWDEIIVYDPQTVGKNNKILSHVSLVKMIKQYEYDYVFTGEYGSLNILIISNIICKDLYLIDDGISTIRMHSIFNPNTDEKIVFKKYLKMLRYIFFGLKIYNKKLLNVFTIYDLKPHSGEQIIQNKYEYLQGEYLQDQEKDENLYLLGQNFVQRKVLDDSTYMSYVKNIIAYYDTTIVYIPHRTEFMSEEFNTLFDEKFILRPSTGPVEISFLERSRYPKHIVSFNSSALFTLNKLFPETKIDAVYIKPDKSHHEYKSIIRSYEFFKNTGVDVLDLK